MYLVLVLGHCKIYCIIFFYPVVFNSVFLGFVLFYYFSIAHFPNTQRTQAFTPARRPDLSLRLLQAAQSILKA